jgi:hypothetical protein
MYVCMYSVVGVIKNEPMFARDYMRRNIMELGEHLRKTRRRLPFMNPGDAGEGGAKERRRQRLEGIHVTRDHVQMFLLTFIDYHSNVYEVSNTFCVCMYTPIMLCSHTLYLSTTYYCIIHICSHSKMR